MLMVNVNEKIFSILNDERLTETVKDVFSGYPTTVEEFPCVCFIDDGQHDTEYADNQNMGIRYECEVHIFTKALEGYPTTFEIGEIVKSLLRENDFCCILNREVPDEQDNVRHRVMGFRNWSF